jgi:hypothetical protein
MTRRHYSWFGTVAVFALLISGSPLLRPRDAVAQGQYPIVDQVAARVIAKYQGATCEQLWEQKAAHAPPGPEEQRAIGLLRSDPQMRAVFINKIAPPIANKMFDCGMIP